VRAPKRRRAPVSAARIREWLNYFGGYRHAVVEGGIRDWLSQFDGEDLDAAARILDAVDYYGQARIAAAYREILQALPGWRLDSAQRGGVWRFAALALSAGESGDRMLADFRHANRLTGRQFDELFCHTSTILQQKLGAGDTLVLVDDFVGTGSQLCEVWNQSLQELVGGIGTVYLAVVAAVSTARLRVQNETGVLLRSGNDLLESDNFFHGNCTHFSRDEKDRILRYCDRANKKFPRGFGECGLLTIMQHRAPNNSLPILHARNSRWTGLFPRDD
jgi:hypothetical protein